ncbi:uncharacterized protein LOC133901509 [Phragmites australis]|uniref:uncharacterized protein LOC133901509 n=1 Tax=Phragmites australis TaxID=29695 RepID=UPI002D79DC77|nr:uncharacterized protein LOC133901509 [Phragmites australis]
MANDTHPPPASPSIPIPTAGSSSSGVVSLSQAIHSINIKSFILFTLDMQANNFSKLKTLFLIILDHFNLQSHVTDLEPHHNDPDCVKENLTILMWIYTTISHELLNLVMKPSSTAYGIWTHLDSIFTGNKPSHAIYLKNKFHTLTQGNLSVVAYCCKLQTLANTLADCDQPISERALIHKLICGLSTWFSILKRMLPALPIFTTFMQARDYLTMDKASQASSDKLATESALVALGTSSNTAPPPTIRIN